MEKATRKAVPSSIKKVRKRVPPPTRLHPDRAKYDRKRVRKNRGDIEEGEGC
jgi:hypothetical protein